MKSITIAATALVLLLAPAMAPPAEAGCLKGAVVGGLAGHFVGHHGLIGAGVGCLIARHHAKVRARQELQTRPDLNTRRELNNGTTSTINGYGSSDYNGSYQPAR